MTNQVEQFDEEMYDDEAMALNALKNTCTNLGVKFHPSIGYDALHAKYTAFINSEGLDDSEQVVLAANVGLVPETAKEQEARIRKEMRKLVRVEVQCLDPLKKDWTGEILTVSNDISTIRRFVPFNTPWHIEEALAALLEERVYQYFIEERQANGFKIKVPKSGKAFSLKRLDALTEKELGLLAIKQARQGD